MLISLITGSETFPHETCKITAFFRSRAAALELVVFEAMKDQHAGLQRVSVNHVAASTRNKNHGNWYTSVCTVTEGSYMRVDISKKGPGDWGYNFRGLMLQMRKDAALRRIRIPFTANHDANLPAGYYEGNFDIVPPDWFEQLGFTDITPSKLERYSDDMDGWYTEEIVEPEKTRFVLPSYETVVTTAGTTLRLPKPAAKRVIRLKR